MEHIKVRVFANAKKEHVEEREDGTLKIFVREPPLRNLANFRVREIVAARFSVPVGWVRIVTGHHSPGKLLEIRTGE